MEENKVATDKELRELAERIVGECELERFKQGATHFSERNSERIFRELVAVRDQAAKYRTAEEWKRMHAEITND